ncbi:60Kd inner membrane protein-domain-containing protein [Daedaleopsis nitida]|nr:60Kd inner membrane protein-domain-containing protein [Daedaleopsis nitida]
MVLCMGCMGRLGLRSTRPMLSTSAVRLLSTTTLQNSRLQFARQQFRSLPPGSRSLSLWGWSTSKTPGAAQSTPAEPTPADPVPAAAEVTTPELLPAEASTPVDVASAPTPDVALLPDVPVLTEGLPVDALLSIPTALNYGDLAALGLAGWTPAGICRWTMELINVSTGLPWVWTIVTTTVLSRVLLFPFTVKQMQSTAALAPYQNEIAAIRDEMNAAQAKKDMLAMQRAALKQKMIYEKAGVSLSGMALAPFIQLPVTLGMFFGVKTMCDLPVEQLKWSGLSWLPDLTVADPTWTLPIIATILMNVQISVSMRDLVASTPQTGHIMNALRVLTTGSVFLMGHLNIGVLVYLMTSILTMTGQSLLLRQAGIRRALGIPIIPKHLRAETPSMRDSLVYAKKWWQSKMDDARTTASKR